MVFDDEWQILKDYEENINSEWSILQSTNLKTSEKYITDLKNFNAQIQDFVSQYSGSYDSYVGKYIIDGDEDHKNDLSSVNYFDKLKNIYKNWQISGYKTGELLPTYPNDFANFMYDIDDKEQYSLNNEFNLIYECNISGSNDWKNIANIQLKKESFDTIEDLDKNLNSKNFRWIWNVKVKTHAILGTSNYYLPKTYPYDWAVYRPALISWYDNNRIIDISTTSSIYIPGVRGALFDEVGGAPKRVGAKNGRYVYTYSTSSYNLFQDYTSSFSPNGIYNSKSEIQKYNLDNNYIYLNFGSGEHVPIPILSKNTNIIPHEDNIYSSRIREFQSSSLAIRQMQLITSNPYLTISTNFIDEMPFRIDIKVDNQNVLFSGEKNKDLNFEILHNGKNFNVEKMLFESGAYTNQNGQDLIYKEVEINFYCRDWILKTDENIQKSISTIL